MVVENRAASSSKPQGEESVDLDFDQLYQRERGTRDWVTLREFARIIGVTYQTVLRYKADGKIAVMRIGGRFRVSVDEVKRFEREGNLPSSGDPNNE
jgi:excisionase family DNA binding protein